MNTLNNQILHFFQKIFIILHFESIWNLICVYVKRRKESKTNVDGKRYLSSMFVYIVDQFQIFVTRYLQRSFLLFPRFEERNHNRNIGMNHARFPSVHLSFSKPSEQMFYRLKTRIGSGSNKYRIVSDSFIFPFCIAIDSCGRANEENRFLLAPVPIRK